MAVCLPDVDLLQRAVLGYSTLLMQGIAVRRKSPTTGRETGLFPASQRKSRLALTLEMQAGF